MQSELRLFLVAEDRWHFTTVCKLVDRVLVEAIDWIDEGTVEHLRGWAGFGTQSYLSSTSAFREAKSRGFKPYGKFNGGPGAPDAASTRAALLLALDNAAVPEVVVIARDLDGEPSRRTGIQQACAEGNWPFAIVVALPEPEVEAWLIAGFIPKDEQERLLVESLRIDLHFNPTEAPHRLQSTNTGSAKDAKSVLGRLAPDPERQEECLDAPLAHLRLTRYEATGLVAFLDGIGEKIVPIAGKTPRK